MTDRERLIMAVAYAGCDVGPECICQRRGTVIMACYEAAEKQASALARELDAAGWQLVPREPTQEMYAAGDTAFEGGYVREVYRDMLAAAPQSPLAPQSEP